jgi:hypothetical protein
MSRVWPLALITVVLCANSVAGHFPGSFRYRHCCCRRSSRRQSLKESGIAPWFSTQDWNMCGLRLKAIVGGRAQFGPPGTNAT